MPIFVIPFIFLIKLKMILNCNLTPTLFLDIMFFYMLAIMLCFFVSFINSASISSVENQELSM